MSDSETFFDRIYPSISRRLDELEREQKHNLYKIFALQEERKHLYLTVDQYKAKIQRIEQFLIEHGLIKLLGKEQ